jgi:transcriptional regulator with XRE-family HTH domain
MHMWK